MMKFIYQFPLFFLILLVSFPADAALKDAQKFQDWVSRCETGSSTQVCYIEQNLVSGENDKKRVLGIQFGYYNKKVIGNFILPLGVLLQHGVGIVVDGFEFSRRIPFTYCHQAGCSASFQLDAEMIAMLKKGKKLEISAKSLNGKDFSLPVSLNGFTQAFNALTTD